VATLRAYKALDSSGSGTVSSVVAALADILAWCLSNPNKPFVINLSLNGGQSSTLDNELYALQQNCHVCISVAAGNSGGNACDYSPSDATGVLSVMATDDTDTIASFSNTGSCTNLAAPGVNVQGAWPFDGNGNPCNDCTAILSGTSMASPLGGGVCAIYLGMAVPNWVPGNENAGSTILQDVLDEATPSLPLVFSYVNASLFLAPNPPPLPPPPPPNPPRYDPPEDYGQSNPVPVGMAPGRVEPLLALGLLAVVWWV
jgi:subtilisin family serine protease